MSATHTTIGQILDLLRRNDKLVDRLCSGSDSHSYSALSELSRESDELAELVSNLTTQVVEVAKDPEVKARQEALLGEMESLSKKLSKFASFPELRGIFHAQIAAIHEALARTHANTEKILVRLDPADLIDISRVVNKAKSKISEGPTRTDMLKASTVLQQAAISLATKLTQSS